MQNNTVIIVILIIVAIVAMASKSSKKSALGQPRYRARALMTRNELEFFRRLRSALPDEYIFPQVAMLALIEPVPQAKQRQQDLNRVSQKRVDYCIYTADLQLLAIVELDDRTHSKAADRERDAYVASAGIRTVRFESRNKPTIDEIRASVFPANAPESKSPSPTAQTVVSANSDDQ